MRTLLVLVIAFFANAGLALAQEGSFDNARFLSRVTPEVIRAKSSKIQGGDWDDKTDRISFRIKIRNSDPNLAFNGVKMELYVFAESIIEKKAFKLLQKVTETINLTPLQTYEYESEETTTKWDSTMAAFGAKYKGWYLFLYSPSGELLMTKSSSSIFGPKADLSSLEVGKYYNKDLKPMKDVGR